MLKLYYHVPGDQDSWPEELRTLTERIEEAFDPPRVPLNCWAPERPRKIRYQESDSSYQAHYRARGEITYFYWDCPEWDTRYRRLRVTARTPAAELWLMLNAPSTYQVGGPRENARVHPGNDRSDP